ncbi:MAG TPA: HlyD family efflux transporter periplasmic adaptor subunit [Acidobacteriota bacterium]
MTELQKADGSPERSEPQPQPETSVSPPGPQHSRRWVAPLIVFLVLAAAVFFIWRVFFAAPRVPDSIVPLSGRIEGDDSAVAPKTSGRILEVRVREGDSVNAGDTLAILDDQQVRAREQQARAALSEAEAKAKSARGQIAVLQEELRQNQLQTEQARIDAQGRVRQAEAELAAAEADLAQQEASYRLALFDKEAYTRLAKSGAVSERQGIQAASAADQQAAVVAATKRRVEAARGALTTARASLVNPNIQSAQVEEVRRQITQQQAEAAGASANIEQARAQLVEAQANRSDLIVTAPFGGMVMTRAAEPGEVVPAGTAIVTLLDLTKVYLRGFVPEGQIGKVKAGQAARVYLDSNPSQSIDAYVSRIDPQATFTPENTYFRDERVKQVVGVKLQLKGAIGLAKPGMPADGEILVRGDVWPESKGRK